MRVVGGTILLVLGLSLAVHGDEAHVAFVANIEKCVAHLAVSAELHAKGDRAAALHASHPIQEIGNKVIGPASKVSPALGDQVRTALRGPSAKLKADLPPAQYAQAVRDATASLESVVARVVPADERAKLSFRARVLADLLLGMVTEYREAQTAGKITQLVEYQDAYAFFTRARAVYGDLAPSLRAKHAALAADLERDFAALARALPGLAPPAAPMPADRMQTTVTTLVQSLRSIPARD